MAPREREHPAPSVSTVFPDLPPNLQKRLMRELEIGREVETDSESNRRWNIAPSGERVRHERLFLLLLLFRATTAG